MEFYQSAKFKAWVIIPKITGALSIVGSSLIIRDVFRRENRRKRLKVTTNRIVSLISIFDVIYSFIPYFLGTWLVPKEVGVWSASGNQATCTFQGFVAHFLGGATTLLNATLAMTYVLVVRFHWKDDRLQMYFMSFLLLVVPVLASLGFHLWPLIDQAYNWAGAWMCSIGPAPFGCTGTEGLYPCARGTQAPKMEMASMIWVQVCFALIFVSTVTLYWTVLERERATDRYAVDESQRNRKQSKRVAMQGIWYAGSFFLTWISWWIIVIRAAVTSKPAPYWLVTTHVIFVPLQGFFNAIVYFRPRFVNKKRRSSQNVASSLRPSTLARRAIGMFDSRESAKNSETRINALTMSGRSIDVPSLASGAGKGMEPFKDEEEKWEEE